MEKEKIVKITACIEITPNLIFIDEQEKSKIIHRLEKIKSIIEMPCCNNEKCHFQIVMYCYSLIELLVKKFLGINTNPHFRDMVDKSYIFDFLPQNISDLCTKMRRYRNRIHLNAEEAQPVSVGDAISNTEDVFKWLSMPKLEKPELIELIHSADLSNKNDCYLLEKYGMEVASIKSLYKDYINEKDILSLPISINKDYEQFLGKFISIFREVYTSDANHIYSYWMKNGIRKSIDLFSTNLLKQMISSSSKKMAFYYNCDDNIDYFIYKFSNEIIESIKSKYFVIGSNLNNSTWITSLLYSLITISSDINIYDILECILIVYERSSFAQALDMASDMFWPTSPQTAACLNKQKEAIRDLFNLDNKVNQNTKNDLLFNLIKGKKYSCTVYCDQNNKHIGLFEDDRSHSNEISELYNYYLSFLLSRARNDFILLHAILKDISSFDKDVSYKIMKFTMANVNSNNITEDIYKDLINIKNSDFFHSDMKKQFMDFMVNIKSDNEDGILEVALMFNQTGKITDEGKDFLLKGNFERNLLKVLDHLDDQEHFGYYISGIVDLSKQFNKVINEFLRRNNDVIFNFLKGYFCNNEELANELYENCKDEYVKVNLLLLLKLDDSTFDKVESLKNDSRHLYWNNFSIYNIYDFRDSERNAYIIKELINAYNIESALNILSYLYKFYTCFCKDQVIADITLKLLDIVAKDIKIDLKTHFNGQYFSPNETKDSVKIILENFDVIKYCNELFEIEFILADRGLDFYPKAIGHFLYKDPSILKHIFENKALTSLLNQYWDLLPGYNSADDFSDNEFENWFKLYDDIKKDLLKDDLNLVSLLLAKVYSHAPISDKLPLEKLILDKLSQIDIDWFFYASCYMDRLKDKYDIFIDPEGLKNLISHFRNNILYLEKYNYNNVVSAFRYELKTLKEIMSIEF